MPVRVRWSPYPDLPEVGPSNRESEICDSQWLMIMSFIELQGQGMSPHNSACCPRVETVHSITGKEIRLQFWPILRRAGHPCEMLGAPTGDRVRCCKPDGPGPRCFEGDRTLNPSLVLTWKMKVILRAL